MKKLLAILLSVMMIVGMMVFPTAAADQEGDLNYGKDWYDISWYNTTDTVFEISTAKQLYGLAYLTHIQKTIKAIEDITDGKTFKLTADIDLNPDYTYNQETQTFVKKADAAENASLIEFPGILRFCGTLDGQGHTISGLHMETYPSRIKINGRKASDKIAMSDTDTTTTNQTSVGDYAFICRIINGTVKNLVMTNGLVKKGGAFIGTVSGNTSPSTRTMFGATVENVYVDVDASRAANEVNETTSSPTGQHMGGIINSCYFNTGDYDHNVRDAWIVLNNVVYAGTLSTDATSSAMANGVGGFFAYPQLKRSATTTRGTMKMTNCLFLGTISVTSGITQGAIIGNTSRAGTEGTAYTKTNCYESATALATAMAADTTLANNWKTTDKGVVPATVAEMLNSKTISVTRSTPVDNEESFSLRILQGISDLNWKSVGFRVELYDATNSKWYSPVDSTMNKVYTSITAAGATVTAAEEPFESDYIYGVVIKGVPASGKVQLRITPLKEMADGTVVCYQAQAVYCTINDGVVQK